MSQFTETISNLSSSIMDGAKKTISSYKPSQFFDPKKAFSRIAEQGIANLSYRSPILADIAHTMLQSVQLEMERKTKNSNLIKTDSAIGFRNAVAEKLGVGAKTSNINAEMLKILGKIDKSIDKEGLEETRKSTFFKEYETHLDAMKVAQDTKVPDNHEPNDQDESTLDEEILGRIETNTLRTFNALEALASKMSLGGYGGGGGGSGMSFIDPITGMPSISAAIGSLGGSFLSKIFTDETLDKFAKKAKVFLKIDSDNDVTDTVPTAPQAKSNAAITELVKNSDVTDTVPTAPQAKSNTVLVPELKSPEVKKRSIPRPAGIDKKSIDSILGGLSLDLNSTHDKNSVFSEPKNKENSFENLTEKSLVEKKSNEKILDVQLEILAELKKLNKKEVSKNKESTPSTLDDAKSKVAYKLGKTIGKRLPGIRAALGSIRDRTTGMLSKRLGGVSKGVNTAIQLGAKAASYVPELGKSIPNMVSKSGGLVKSVLPVLGGLSIGGVVKSAISKLSDGFSVQKTLNPLSRKGISVGNTGGIFTKGLGLAGQLGKSAIQLGAKGVGSAIQLGAKGVGSAIQLGAKAASYIPSLVGAAKTLPRLLASGVARSGIGALASAALPALASAGSSVLAAGSAALPALASAGSSVLAAGSAALPALAVGSAGAAGYSVGKNLVNPLIDKGLSAITGSKTSLGSYIYDKLHPEDPFNTPQSKNNVSTKQLENTVQLPVAAKSANVQAINTVNDKKEKQDKDEKSASTKPIIISQGANSAATSGVESSPVILGGNSIRNTDSTFERVQMHDFWPRMA